mmetsp:Transcript_11145/g.23546  ORF Transcript_11145/g.23546 Transcript_11145/m.23546 type:complete len:219 (+) Transcript_11145:318-974(+)
MALFIPCGIPNEFIVIAADSFVPNHNNTVRHLCYEHDVRVVSTRLSIRCLFCSLTHSLTHPLHSLRFIPWRIVLFRLGGPCSSVTVERMHGAHDVHPRCEPHTPPAVLVVLVGIIVVVVVVVVVIFFPFPQRRGKGGHRFVVRGMDDSFVVEERSVVGTRNTSRRTAVASTVEGRVHVHVHVDRTKAPHSPQYAGQQQRQVALGPSVCPRPCLSLLSS